MTTLEARPATGALCEARGVSHEYRLPNGQMLRVLEDISLAVRPNEVVALLGPSGCGKSTLLRIFAGLITPTHGEVLYHDAAMAGLNPGVAIVFQSFALYPWLSVAQNVRTVLEARGVPEEELDGRVEGAVERVGLAGFESAFPRELSGGMKQRVGMARALAVDPELLFMDEPFSQVDALTAESLRAEVIDIWAAHDRKLSSILMVSHDIKEVVYMADRIVVMGTNPGRVRTVVENPLPRPRDYRSAELQRLVDQLHDVITGSEMPDIAAPVAAPQQGPIEPLPDATPSEIIGLLEYLDARGGKEELFRIVSDTHREFGQVISIVKAAEMLDLVDTPKRMVTLATDGARYLRAGPEERRAVWREQLLKLRLFRDLDDVLKRQPDLELDRDFVYETLALALPEENYGRMFDLLTRWARAGDLFEYDSKRRVLHRPED
ncbi:MAG TPA: nitrate/sulfonate/bicarbonate ABC transporter ATP-binding protein [Candidatus Eisenbacteria bacterium]